MSFTYFMYQYKTHLRHTYFLKISIKAIALHSGLMSLSISFHRAQSLGWTFVKNEFTLPCENLLEYRSILSTYHIIQMLIRKVSMCKIVLFLNGNDTASVIWRGEVLLSWWYAVCVSMDCCSPYKESGWLEQILGLHQI